MPVARKITGRGAGRARSVPVAGRGRGAVGRGGKKPSRGKRAPSPVYSEAGFSLYSTDSEDQVTSTNKGLDRCAALLGDILSREPTEKPAAQGPKQKPSKQPKAKTKANPAKSKVAQSKSKTTKPSVQRSAAPPQNTTGQSPEKHKQGNLSPYAFRVPRVPVQVPSATQRTLFNERIPSSTPNLSPAPKRPPSPATLLQLLRAQNRDPIQTVQATNMPHSPPQKDGGQYHQGEEMDATPFSFNPGSTFPATQPPQYNHLQSAQDPQLDSTQNYVPNQPEQPYPTASTLNQQTYQLQSGYYQPDADRHQPLSVGNNIGYPLQHNEGREYTTSNGVRGEREQLDNIPVRDREDVSPTRRSLFQPIKSMQGDQLSEGKASQEQDSLDDTLTASPKRVPSQLGDKSTIRASPGRSLQTLRYLLRELQAVADDPEVKRLVQDVERIVGQLPEARRAADMQTDIDLALQPLRSENSQLRRRARILNQQLREKERAERENRAPDFSFELESLRSLNMSLEKQLQDQAGLQEALQCRVEDLRTECDQLRLDNKHLLDMVGQKGTDSLMTRAEWDNQMARVKKDVSDTLQQVQGLKLKLEAVEMENGTLLVTIRQKDAEIRRLEVLTRDLHSSMSYLLRDLQNSGPGARSVDGLTLERAEQFLRTHSVDSVIQLASPEGGQPNFYGSPTRKTPGQDVPAQTRPLQTSHPHHSNQLPQQQEPRPLGDQLSHQPYKSQSHAAGYSKPHLPGYHGNRSPRQQWEPRPTAGPRAELPKTPASVKRALQFDDVNGRKKENVTGSSLTEQHLADHQRKFDKKNGSDYSKSNSTNVPNLTEHSFAREAPPSPRKHGVGRDDMHAHSFNGFLPSDVDHDSTMYASLPSNVGRPQWKPAPTRPHTERKVSDGRKSGSQYQQENGRGRMEWYQSHSQPYKQDTSHLVTDVRSFRSSDEKDADLSRPNSKQDSLFKGTVLDSSLSTVDEVEAQSITSETTVTSQDERVFQQELAELDASIARVQASLKGAVTFKLP